MTIERNVRFQFNNNVYDLSVKIISFKSIWYFFINDRNKEQTILGGETLKFVYTDHFISFENEANAQSDKIPAEVTIAIQNMLKENKQLWS